MTYAAPYPCRYGVQRSDARQFARVLETADRATLSFSRAEQHAMNLALERLKAAGFRPKELVALPHLLSQETQGLLAFGEWVLAGKPVVDVSPELSAAFARSDCADMRLEDALPLESCAYYHFRLNPVDGVRYSQGRVEFEGAYVMYSPAHAIRVVVCGRKLCSLAVCDQWEERYDLRIPRSLFGLGADHAIEEALHLDLADIGRALALTDAAAVLGERMKRDHEAYRFAVRMVLNALAYRRHVQEVLPSQWPSQAPEGLIRKAVDGSPRERERAISKLWHLGFVPVQSLGMQFGEALDGQERSSPVSHWRRGHWRNQPHGPQMSLRKLIWVTPVRVHPRESASPA